MKKSAPVSFALFGNPVGHSLSPLMHNAAYKEMKIAARYCSCCVQSPADIITVIQGSNLRGAGITIPFKTAVMPYLDEIDRDARQIGAVNTVLHDDNGRLKGYNTDWIGIVRNLEQALEIQKKTFAIVGAGGTARAAVFGILEKGGTPCIINRTLSRAEEIGREFGCPSYPLSEIGNISADCLINTTPVGMAPDVGKSPLPKDVIQNFSLVMDVIYNPLRTQLLKDAEAVGSAALNGVGMLVHQGAEQIRIWMGKKPPVALMKRVIFDNLREHNGK